MIITKEIRGTVALYFDTKKKCYTGIEFSEDDCGSCRVLDPDGEEMGLMERSRLGMSDKNMPALEMVQPIRPMSTKTIHSLLRDYIYDS